jgi:hypothetical protein
MLVVCDHAIETNWPLQFPTADTKLCSRCKLSKEEMRVLVIYRYYTYTSQLPSQADDRE